MEICIAVHITLMDDLSPMFEQELNFLQFWETASSSEVGSSDSSYFDASPYNRCPPFNISTDTTDTNPSSNTCSSTQLDSWHPSSSNTGSKEEDSFNVEVGQNITNWIDNMAFQEDVPVDDGTSKNNPSKALYNYYPDFSDFQDESYSFWQTAIEDDLNQADEDHGPLEPINPNVLPDFLDSSPPPPARDAMDEEQPKITFNDLKKHNDICVGEFPIQNSQFSVCDSNGASAMSPSHYSMSFTAEPDLQANYQRFEQSAMVPAPKSTSSDGQSYNDNFCMVTNQKHASEGQIVTSTDLPFEAPSMMLDKTPPITSISDVSNNQSCYLYTASNGSKFLVINNNVGSRDSSQKHNAEIVNPKSSQVPIKTNTKSAKSSNIQIVLPPVVVLPVSGKQIPATENTADSFVTSPTDQTQKVPTTPHYKRVHPAVQQQVYVTQPPKRKTVRELLAEKYKTTFKNLSKQNLARSTSAVGPIKSVCPVYNNSVHSSAGRASILVLYPKRDLSTKTRSGSVFSSSDSSPSINLSNTSEDGRKFPIPTMFHTGSLWPPPLQNGKVDASQHKPKHFDLLQLHIGNFSVSGTEDLLGKIHSKFKAIFSKRHFVYEFPLSTLPGMVLSRRIVRIVVPFKIVTGIDCRDDVVNIRVDSQPHMYLGTKQKRIGVIANVSVFDTSQPVDVTSGEVARCRVHKLQLRSQQAGRFRSCIYRFNPNFVLTSLGEELLNQPDETNGLLPVSDTKTALRKTKKVIRHPPQFLDCCSAEEDLLLNSQVCSCGISCRSLRCSCAKAARRCNVSPSLCLCSECDNPLNVLEEMNINPELAVQDSCLFQNIYNVENLRCYLSQEMRMPCCNTLARLQECIPFRLLCPNTDCTEVIEYSWCRQVLCCPERNPRNHCSVCGKCCFSIGRHCEKCNTCFNVRIRSLGCPNCSKMEEENREVEMHRMLMLKTSQPTLDFLTTV